MNFHKTLLFVLMFLLVPTLVIAFCDTEWSAYTSCNETVRLEANCTTAMVYNEDDVNTENLTLNYSHGEYYFTYTLFFTELGSYYIDFCDNITYTLININEAGYSVTTQSYQDIGQGIKVVSVVFAMMFVIGALFLLSWKLEGKHPALSYPFAIVGFVLIAVLIFIVAVNLGSDTSEIIQDRMLNTYKVMVWIVMGLIAYVIGYIIKTYASYNKMKKAGMIP